MKFTCYCVVPSGIQHNRLVHAWLKGIVQIDCTLEQAQDFARTNNATRLRKEWHDINLRETGCQPCHNCGRTGRYGWGAIVNGVPTHSGPCYQCQEKGYVTVEDRRRNWGYNMHKKVF